MQQKLHRIRLVGWYGKGASGDDLLARCTEAVFRQAAAEQDIAVEFTEGDDHDLLLIGGGTILGSWHGDIRTGVEASTAPILVFGSGFRELLPDQMQRNRRPITALLKRCCAIGVRGPLSMDKLTTHFPEVADKVEIIGDPALGFAPLDLGYRQNGRHRVALSVRHLGGNELQNSGNAHMQRLFAELADHFVRTLSSEVTFISFSGGEFEDDMVALKRCHELMRTRDLANVRFVEHCDPPELQMSRLGGFDVVLSQRLHATVAAWLQGIPTVILDYQFDKATDLFGALGGDYPILRSERVSVPAYLDAWQALQTTGPTLLAQLRKQRVELRHRQLFFARTALEHMLRRTVHAPIQAERTCTSILKSYLRRYWHNLLLEGRESVALFGAGKHTEWLLNVVAGALGPKVAAILDDRASELGDVDGFTVVNPEIFTVSDVDAVVVSSDTCTEAMKRRCRELWQDRTIVLSPYDGLPPGPYEK